MAGATRERGRRLRADGADTRRRMLAAGTDLAAEMPFGRLTVQHVTDAAGTGRATFYLYFNNIDEFLVELGAESCAALVATAERAWAIDDPIESIESFIRSYVSTFRQHHGVLGMCYSRRFQGSGFTELLVGTRNTIVNGFTKMLEAGIRSGRFTPLDARLVSDGLVCMVEALCVHELDDGHKGSLDHVVRTLTVIWTRAVVAEAV